MNIGQTVETPSGVGGVIFQVLSKNNPPHLKPIVVKHDDGTFKTYNDYQLKAA